MERKEKLSVIRDIANRNLAIDLGCEFVRYTHVNSSSTKNPKQSIKKINGILFRLFGDEIRIFLLSSGIIQISIVTDVYKNPNTGIWDSKTISVKTIEEIENRIYEYYFE